jgi:hypothetical protein
VALPAGYPSFAPGIVDPTQLGLLQLLALFARDPSAIVAQRVAAQSIPNSAFTAISWDTELQDNDNQLTVPTSSLVLPNPGVYVGFGGVQFAGSASGSRTATTFKNGGEIVGSGQDAPANASGTRIICGAVFTGVAGDIISVNVFQGSGGALNINGAIFGVVRISGPRS